jgi:hypothetical protein
MVRLRREIEGLDIDHGIPWPTHCLDRDASEQVLPSMDQWLTGDIGPRVLMAGAPRPHLAIALCEAGHQVTITDLAPEEVKALHASLSPGVSGRLNLVAKPYGTSSFSASSFDTVLFSDLLHVHEQPKWLLNKMYRELKFDGLLMARLYADGEIVAAPSTAENQEHSQPRAGSSTRLLVNLLERLGHGVASWIVLNADGRDAVERGAHLSPHARTLSSDVQLATITERLRVEEMLYGHSLRCRAAGMVFGLRSWLRTLVLSLLHTIPELANPSDASGHGAQVIAIRARKALGNL